MSVNISLIVLKKMYDILMILVNFCGHFPGFWLIFGYPDPVDQNETLVNRRMGMEHELREITDPDSDQIENRNLKEYLL